ncbi:XdhC family protein [Burkholderia aenigmatica]|uniref:XdhC family protein n=1 Tax=Burkholderia cepacia complex TaxID=87882 RepID=UPI001C231CB4|nr:MULTISPECIES: XdhC family protein [Burkholderia cepacia complex]HDR8923044.1 XdhC family protein [Burkholderia vietnamiensis]MBU9445232.1 XdhC family protein [Burkholderia multivorans]MCA8222096.1 XdhC family protein [Burkholderia multivorans]UKD17550.1 XdhC family protein [Burkholderia aenigmatica]HDR8980666.1 XdhC family protein [Burkholderia vietnamiensis]
MEGIDLDVLTTAAQWVASGRTATLAVVVHTWGSAPRPPGALLLIRDDGRIRGSVSGGCIEDALIERAHAGDLPADLPEVVVYGANADEARRFGLPCGGTMKLVLEPLTSRSCLPELLEAIGCDRLVQRRLDLETGAVTLAPSGAAARVEFDGRTLSTLHGSRDRLLLIGAGQLSGYLATMARAVGYDVIVCDPRPEYTVEWDLPDVELRTTMPDDTVVAMNPDPNMAVVALTHDPKLDDMALLEALKSSAFYVGAIGSRANDARRRERLRLFDLTDAQIARLHGPVGLHLGARTPSEIAVSIVAEMIAVRNGVGILQTHALRVPSTAAVCLSSA